MGPDEFHLVSGMMQATATTYVQIQRQAAAESETGRPRHASVKERVEVGSVTACGGFPVRNGESPSRRHRGTRWQTRRLGFAQAEAEETRRA